MWTYVEVQKFSGNAATALVVAASTEHQDNVDILTLIKSTLDTYNVAVVDINKEMALHGWSCHLNGSAGISWRQLAQLVFRLNFHFLSALVAWLKVN